MELIHDKIKIKDLLDWKRKNMLKVNPEYQRGAVWKVPQQKKLIDSVFRGYPLPLIYLHYKKETIAGMTSEGLEIIDGQQRINALYSFGENALKLFDPIKDDKIARFPNFIKRIHCAWASCDFIGLPEDLREKFNNTELLIVKVITDNEDEARDLFIRLQAGLPLNAQEKRDAWPGGYTEFVLKFGGKKELTRYPGHDFFKKHIHTPATDRGAIRTLCAQIGMLFFEGATRGNWMDIGTQPVDDYYYRNLDFDITLPQVARFSKILDLAVELFQGYKGPKLKVHEAIHIILYLDSLFDDYTKSWQAKFIHAFDLFRGKTAIDTKAKSGDFWYKYGSLISTAAASSYTIQRRHKFFSENMIPLNELILKDCIRTYGQLEREIIYYRDYKICAVCYSEIKWNDLEIHHLDEHQNGGQTTIDNGLPVHKDCHPKGQAAIIFFNDWKLKQMDIEQLKSKKPDNEDIVEKYLTPPDDREKKTELIPQEKFNRIGQVKKNDVLLDQIIPVIKSIKKDGKEYYTIACSEIAAKLGVHRNTVADKCTRILGLSTEMFIEHVEKGTIHGILKNKYPNRNEMINIEL